MAKKAPPKYRVLRDTGEKENRGWWFDESPSCLGTTERNLYTADYSLVLGGDDLYERKLFVVERKGSVTEFVANITQSEKWDDFKQELERLEEFAFPWVICEFPYSLIETYPKGSGIPTHLQKYVRVTPQFLAKRLWEIQLRFRTKFLFADRGGRDAASSLFKRIAEHVNDGR